MAWPLLPSLVLLLFPGSWIHSEVLVAQRVVGQTFSVRCQYPPTNGAYQKKSWCKEMSSIACTRLISSSRPWTQIRVSRFSMWDDPSAGFFTVTMTALEEEDSGRYWCTMYHPSSASIAKSSKFDLVVSPAPTSSKATMAPRKLVFSQTQSFVPQIRRTSMAPGALTVVTTRTELQNATLDSSPAALVSVFCGLLVTKSLVLLVLLPRALRKPRRLPRSFLKHPTQPRPCRISNFQSHKTQDRRPFSLKPGLPGASL